MARRTSARPAAPTDGSANRCSREPVRKVPRPWHVRRCRRAPLFWLAGSCQRRLKRTLRAAAERATDARMRLFRSAHARHFRSDGERPVASDDRRARLAFPLRIRAEPRRFCSHFGAGGRALIQILPQLRSFKFSGNLATKMRLAANRTFKPACYRPCQCGEKAAGISGLCVMWFLLRLTFWLGVILVLLPSGGSQPVPPVAGQRRRGDLGSQDRGLRHGAFL